MRQYLLGVIGQSDKPMTFAEIAARAFPEGSFEADMTKLLGASNVARVRSLRRALHKLCDRNVLLAVGQGGRGDPHRYCFDPLFVAIFGDKEDYKKACAVIEADPAGSEAANNSKLMQSIPAALDKLASEQPSDAKEMAAHIVELTKAERVKGVITPLEPVSNPALGQIVRCYFNQYPVAKKKGTGTITGPPTPQSSA
jgi:hypothetical protein